MAYPQPNFGQPMFQQQHPSYYQSSYLPQMNNIPIGLRGRPVSSIEEVRASMIDFDGTTFYFPDASKKSIYTKKMNLDGTASLETYRLVETPLEAPPASVENAGFVTRDVFEQTIQNILNQIEFLKKGDADNGATTTTIRNNDEQFNF